MGVATTDTTAAVGVGGGVKVAVGGGGGGGGVLVGGTGVSVGGMGVSAGAGVSVGRGSSGTGATSTASVGAFGVGVNVGVVGKGVLVKVGNGVRVGRAGATCATGVLVAHANPAIAKAKTAQSHCCFFIPIIYLLILDSYPLAKPVLIQFHGPSDFCFCHRSRFPADWFGAAAFKVFINFKKVGRFF